MDERMKFVACRLAGEPMVELCREFGISRKTGYKIFDRWPTDSLRLQMEQNIGDLSNSLRIKDILSFQGLVWISRVISIPTLDLAILVRVQASRPNFSLCGNDLGLLRFGRV